MKNTLRLCASALAVSIAAGAAHVHAQETGDTETSAANPGEIQEVIVTATRRMSTVREVPFSIAAFSGQELRNQQVFSPSALVQQVPGITLNTSDKSLSIVAVRGNVSTFRTATLDTPVAFFVDDVYYVFNNDLNANFYDTQRVEMLRGPQGTLFGRNVVGGALAVVTNNPQFTDDYYLSVTGGNGGYFRTEGMVNGELVDDRLAGRLAFSTERSDGLIETPHQRGSYGEVDSYAARGKLLWQPTDALTVLFSADYSHAKGNGGAVELAAGGNQVFPPSAGDFVNEEWTNNNHAEAPNEQTLRGGYVRADWEVLGGTLTAISGYRLNNSYNYLDNVPTASVVPVFGLEQYVSNRSFTQEVRFASAPGRLSYVAGAYYLYAKVSTKNNFYYSPLPGSVFGGRIPPNPDITNINREQDGKVRSIAAFGEVTFNATERLSLVVGARYTRDHKSIDYRAYSLTAGTNPIPAFAYPGPVHAAGGADWEATTPRVSVRYRVGDETNLYLTWAKGFKSGGFVDNAYTNPTLPLDPEKATNIEGGVKSRFFDNRVNVNLSVFRQETRDLQNFSGAGGIAHTYNGTALSKGVELESSARVTDALRVTLNYAFIDGKYTSLKDPLATADYSGNPLKYTPRHSFTLGGNHVTTLGNGATLTAQADFNYGTRVHMDDANALENFANLFDKTRGRTLNARLTWQSPDARWSLGVWGKNLTDNYQIVLADDIGAFVGSYPGTSYWKLFTNQPRTFGVTLSIKP